MPQGSAGRFLNPFSPNDAISWTVLQVTKISEDFIPGLFENHDVESHGEHRSIYSTGTFWGPRDEGTVYRDVPVGWPSNTRFSIKLFTGIGLGALTGEMREHLTV